jgi:Xaa-Pro aminopeptidase
MGVNSTARIASLCLQLAEKGIEGVFISQTENRCYLSGFDGSDGYLILTAKNAILATDFRYIEQSKQQAPDFEVFQITGKVEEWFPRITSQLGIKNLGFESGQVTYAFHRQLSTALEKAGSKLELVPIEGLVESLRIVKSPEEIEFIARAADISDIAIADIKEKVRPGMTELDVAWEIERFMRENGSQPIPFEVIAQSGPNSAMPHARPSERRISEGEPILIDIGAKVNGYASDITRTFCIGTPDAMFKKIYDIVLGAQLAALSLVKEGMTGEYADNLARIIISEAGYGDKFGHSLGHGVGLAVHESPRLGPNSTDVLKSGMVFSIEPGIYLPGWGGVRIEDLVTLEKGEIRVLSKAPKSAK